MGTGQRLSGALKALNKDGLPDVPCKGSDGESSAHSELMQGGARTRGLEPHEMKVEAAATKEQRTTGLQGPPSRVRRPDCGQEGGPREEGVPLHKVCLPVPA